MREHLKLIWGLRPALLVGIFRGCKLVEKGGESSKAGGEHVVLLTQRQSWIPTQRQVRSLVPTLQGGGIGPSWT